MAAAAKITADQLAEYTQLEEQRKELDRQSRAIAKRQSILSDHFKAALEKSGTTSATRGPHKVSLIEGKASVQWKSELLRRIGPLEVAAIAEAAPTTVKLLVETIEAKPARKAA